MKHNLGGIIYLFIGIALCIGLLIFLFSSSSKPHNTIPPNSTSKTSTH